MSSSGYKNDSNPLPELRNYMEFMVFDSLNHIIADLKICDCDICKHDIAAIALNQLQPKYVVTKKGEIYTKLNVLQQQFEVDVISALTKAANIVNEHPRH